MKGNTVFQNRPKRRKKVWGKGISTGSDWSGYPDWRATVSAEEPARPCLDPPARTGSRPVRVSGLPPAVLRRRQADLADPIVPGTALDRHPTGSRPFPLHSKTCPAASAVPKGGRQADGRRGAGVERPAIAAVEPLRVEIVSPRNRCPTVPCASFAPSTASVGRRVRPSAVDEQAAWNSISARPAGTIGRSPLPAEDGLQAGRGGGSGCGAAPGRGLAAPPGPHRVGPCRPSAGGRLIVCPLWGPAMRKGVRITLRPCNPPSTGSARSGVTAVYGRVRPICGFAFRDTRPGDRPALGDRCGLTHGCGLGTPAGAVRPPFGRNCGIAIRAQPAFTGS